MNLYVALPLVVAPGCLGNGCRAGHRLDVAQVSAVQVDQPDLFAQATVEAIRRRNEGMAVVWENDLNAQYRDRLLAAIHCLAAKGVPFCSDDARDLAGDPPRFVHPNVAGSCFNASAKAGLIRMTGTTISRREKGNGNLVRTWVGRQ